MKHNIRINGEVKEIDCELGSGILDKNGREIFEGDTVKFDGDRDFYYIAFAPGIFRARAFNYNRDLHCYSSQYLEIVDD